MIMKRAGVCQGAEDDVMMMMMIRINEGEKGQRKMVTPVRNLRKAIVLESLRQQKSCLSRVEALLQCLLGHMLLSIGLSRF